MVSAQKSEAARFVVGGGYVGIRLARSWRDRGEKVFVTTRSPERAEHFAAEGLVPLVWDVTKPPEQELPRVQTIVYAVGFDRSSDDLIHNVYAGGLRNLLQHCDPSSRVIYISSTGVYGQADGAWLDENSPCQPTRDGGRACLAAEQILGSSDQKSATVLRLAGIYGPDRIPMAAFLERGEALPVVEDAFLNLIHVDDVVRIIKTCAAQESLPECLCVSDGNPVMRGDFYRFLATLLKTKPPEFEAPAEGSTRAARGRGSKRISNKLLKETLDYEFLYPSYQEGLASIFGSDD